MASFLRNHAWRLGLVCVLLAGATVGIAMFRNAPSEAYAGMPADQRAYWIWVGSINRDPASAIDSGIALLQEQPHLPALYLRLADACAGSEAVEACRAALTAAQPPDARAGLYRDAALLRLAGPDTDADVEGWKRLAGAPALDPALARLVVDRARANPEASWLPEIEAVWSEALARDSSQAGIAFGLGYAAVLRNEWEPGERLLRQASRLAPADPQPYRELGRIYFFTSQPDAFEEALQAGIEAARATFDLEQELILSGNLGMAVMNWHGDYERAGTLFETALARARLLSDRRTEGFNYHRLANIRLQQQRYSEALALLDSAEVRYQQFVPGALAEVLALRGATLDRMYRFSEAETVIEAAIESAVASNNVMAQMTSLLSLAQLRLRMGQYAQATTAGLDALGLATQYGAVDNAIVARISLGDVERRRGDFEKAKTHYLEGVELARQTRNEVRLRELYEHLGNRALEVQDANAARTYFEMMLEHTDTSQDTRHLATAYYGLGITYFAFDNLTEAVRLYDLALQAVPEKSESSLRVSILREKASTLAYLGSYEESIRLLNEAQALVGADKDEKYWIEVILGDVYRQMGQYEQALVRYQNAEDLEEGLQWSSIHWVGLYGKALAHWRLNQRREAEQAFREALSVIETLRDYLSSTEERASFVRNKVEVYETFSRFLEEQGRTKEAFHYDERARSRSLVDLLYTTQQGGKPDMNDPVDQAIEMNRRLRAIEQELGESLADGSAPGAAVYRENRAAYLRRERLRADSSYRRIELNLYGQNQLYRFDPLPADSVQAILHPDEALVVFNLRTGVDATRGSERASVAYVLLPDTVIMRPLGVEPRDLAEAIRFFRDEISSSNHGPGQGWQNAAQRLYADLMAPVRAALPATVRHLNIVPDGVLNYLPFAALQHPSGRFLVEDYTLSVVPSATILKLSRERNPRRWSYMLLLADPDGRLPGARKEVLSIAAEAPNRRHVLVGKDATQKTFGEISNNYDVIHFATHGNFISRAPWRSHLELYGDELTVEEIGHLRLDAYLVTLSACETALSSGLDTDVPDGDEWVGLNQAFLAAGTPTVLASLWSIDDRVSSTFMTGFYDELGAEGKAHGLAQMQRRFIQNPSTRHPFYWAAFTLFGDPL